MLIFVLNSMVESKCFCVIAGNGPCLGFRRGPTKPYEWISYNETRDRIKNFGAGLVKLGLKSQSDSQSFVGIFAKTSPEWVITEYSTYAYNLVLVPFYDSLGAEACRSALNRCKLVLEKDHGLNCH